MLHGCIAHRVLHNASSKLCVVGHGTFPDMDESQVASTEVKILDRIEIRDYDLPSTELANLGLSNGPYDGTRY